MNKTRSWLSQHRIFCGFVALVCAIVLISLFVPIYGDICVKSDNTGHQNYTSHHIVLVWLWQAGEITKYYGGAITAIATAFIGWFTYTLKKTSVEQADLTRNSIKLARDEFNATHRPKIYVQSVVVVSNGRNNVTPQVDFWIANGGDGNATLMAYELMGYGQTDDAAFAPEFTGIMKTSFKDLILAPGERQLIKGRCNDFDFEWERFVTGDGRFFLIGRVEYQGSDGIGRITGFCREYIRERGNDASGHWIIQRAPEWEYSY